MKQIRRLLLKQKKTLWISKGFKEAEAKEKAYWFSQSPLFRLETIEILRKINYGKEATKRLQRIFEVAKRS